MKDNNFLCKKFVCRKKTFRNNRTDIKFIVVCACKVPTCVLLHFSCDNISYKLFAHSLYQNIPSQHYCYKSFKIKRLINVVINKFMQINDQRHSFRFVKLGICITFPRILKNILKCNHFILWYYV